MNRDYPCREDGRCQYAIDHGAEGMGHCPKGQCSLPQGHIDYAQLHRFADNNCLPYGEVCAAVRSALIDPEPIPMILYCPNCGMQHIDRDESPSDREWAAQSAGDREVQYWTNPPHRSHKCGNCGCIWRPADVPTTGVAEIKTQGKADTWPVHSEEVVAMAASQGKSASPLTYGQIREACEGIYLSDFPPGSQAYDLAIARAVLAAARVETPARRKLTQADANAWGERHDLMSVHPTDLMAAFEDAASVHLLPTPQEPDNGRNTA